MNKGATIGKVVELSARYREEYLKNFKQKHPSFRSDPVEGVKVFFNFPFGGRLGVSQLGKRFLTK